MSFNTIPVNGWPQLKELQELAEKVGALPTWTSTDKAALEEFIANEQAIIEAATLATDVGELQTTVGDASSGLVKDVDDLQTTVGDNTAGLVKDVADLQTATEESAGNLTDATGFTHDSDNTEINKCGSIVNFNYRSGEIDLSTTAALVGTIADGYRPDVNIYGVGITTDAASVISIVITPAGAVYLTADSTLTSTVVNFNITYKAAPAVTATATTRKGGN